ncbi:ribosome maturation factor RimM [Solemya velum gill symbiont]|uniref:Ribosome maturation factor RimM n=1 Tax=Solemya velum gill symbiont TaxID=2340 RepID=A0A0B0H768_SOVGS|nr:ribosome maturation factor RimM [Solemya velum gill symbiont]KHF24930.1 16S rRNA processing protein RimM [Solemya velum gill symbiont]OOY34594.1 ribosome maturation factor RimM [Solemya velum gill symbiont]OOY37386.1 ribosome maturation factor RimM [Solemya velum gill symbiont]OOY39056.1 ribosome maturation factor RimM [Solemya velum gill symbiont]OOY41726.1 ribosome maturation factor RimM [Solemya velum gill symbiont]
MADKSGQRLVVLGRISGLHGVQGWVKIFSHTDPREGIVKYTPWLIRRDGKWEGIKVVSGRRHGKTVVAKIEGVNDRNQAAELLECDIAVERSQLPPSSQDDYYWTDLENLSVQTVDGELLGRIDYLFETGSNDVMVVQGERQRLIPFIEPDVVKQVDLENGLMVVDWDPEF